MATIDFYPSPHTFVNTSPIKLLTVEFLPGAIEASQDRANLTYIQLTSVVNLTNRSAMKIRTKLTM